MKRFLDAYRRASHDQLVGVSAQIMFAAPALIASLAVARWGSVSLVASLALSVGVASTAFSASSFGLTPYLALFGVRDYSQEVFWLNRVASSLLASLVAVLVLTLMGVSPELTLAAVLLRGSDAMADMAFGLDLLRVSPSFAMRRLFRWSSFRLVIFVAAMNAGHLLGQEAAAAVLTGAVCQFALLLPWKASARIMLTRGRLDEAFALGRGAAHLSVASTMCGLLVTTPRLLAPSHVAATDLGYVGVAFVASTLIGMCFNVAWLRLAAKSRTSDPRRAVIAYLVEGTILGLVLVAGLWLSRPWAARAYHIRGFRFGDVLMQYGIAYIVFYFVMSLANLLKLSSTRLSEARAYLIAAAALTIATFASDSLLVGLMTSAATLTVVVFVSVRGVLKPANA